MKKIGYLITVSVSVVVSLLAMIPITIVNKDNVWMKDVSDDTRIIDMSIPGTHDSGSTHSIFDVAGKCQDTTVLQQAKVGTRFFDLRLQMVNNEFKIVHSFVDQNLKFKDVIKDLADFIREYSSEFMLISIKKEASDVNSSKGFEELLKEDFKSYEDVISYDVKLPSTLRECRGKIFIMSRYDLSFGIPSYSGWNDDTSFTLDNMYIQDNYCISDINEKVNDIKKTIAISNDPQNDKLVVNFTSCYLENAFPPLYSGVAAREINSWFIDYVNENKDYKLGIVVCDFMSDDLANAIIRRNY